MIAHIDVCRGTGANATLSPKNQGEKSMTEERDCIFCWESDEPETLQPLFPGPGALSDVEPTAWVHKSCLEEYSNPTGDDVEEIAALAAEIDEIDEDEPEDFVELEREDMEPAELWDRVIADLTELERRTGGKNKSPATAIVKTCLGARRTTAGKDRP
jgi:hypothetical protein